MQLPNLINAVLKTYSYEKYYNAYFNRLVYN